MPSISTSSWLRVTSSSPERLGRPRRPPNESNSSMNTMHGACSRACFASCRTRFEPTPTYISLKSEPAAWITGTPASPATARARRVLPVPGGPTSSSPFGHFAPIARKRAGSLRYAITSLRSARASCAPPTSSSVSRRDGGVAVNRCLAAPPRCRSATKPTTPTRKTKLPSWRACSPDIPSESATWTRAPDAVHFSSTSVETLRAGSAATTVPVTRPATSCLARSVASTRVPPALTRSCCTMPAPIARDSSEYATTGGAAGAGRAARHTA
jgi:hypothetical protein